MSFIARNIIDRIIQFPSRYKMTLVAGTTDTYDLEPVTGNVTAEGTKINKAYLQPIEDKLQEIDSELAKMTGVIVMWSGAKTAIPTGWALCDGNNGTPNLQDRFIVGAGNTYEVGATGGANTKSISHTHSYSGTTDANSNYIQGKPEASTGTSIAHTDHTHSYSGTTGSGGTATFDVRPPYYALCYIMKL
jgi:hypothetical protein